MTMDVKIEERASFEQVLVKVFVLLLPSIAAGAIWGPNARLATSIGYLLGAPIAWYCVPPRGTGKKFLLLLLIIFLVCGVRILLP